MTEKVPIPGPIATNSSQCPDQQGFLSLGWQNVPLLAPQISGEIGWPYRPFNALPLFGIDYAGHGPNGEAVVSYCGTPPGGGGGGGGAMAFFAPSPGAEDLEGGLGAMLAEEAPAPGLVFDRFDRLDISQAGLRRADTGQEWVAPAGGWSVEPGYATAPKSTPGAPMPVALVEAGESDGRVAVIFVGNGAARQRSRVVFRASGPDAYVYLERRTDLGAPHSDGYYLGHRRNGMEVELACYQVSGAEGIDLVSVSLAGEQIAVSVNGIPVLSATEAFNREATQYGIAGSDNAQFGEFSVRSQDGRLCVCDRFTRKGHALGTATSGHDWCAEGGQWQIRNGCLHLQQDAPSPSIITLDTGTADCVVSVRLPRIGVAGSRLVFRCSDPDNYLYVQAGLYSVHIGKREQGRELPILAPMTWSPEGRNIGIGLRGAEITLYLNGRMAATARESFNASATRYGVGAGSASAEASVHVYEDFVVEAAPRCSFC